MVTKYTEQLRAIEGRCREAAARQTGDAVEQLAALEKAATNAAASWSGSCIGYHATVYYEGLVPPPAGAHFNSEWGLMPTVISSSGNWREYSYEEVEAKVRAAAGDPDLTELRIVCDEVAAIFRDEQSRFESIVSAAISGVADEYLDSLRSEARDLKVLSLQDAIRVQMPRGTIMSRDPVAMAAGLRHAPHQAVLAEVVALRGPFAQCETLARLCSLAVEHMELTTGEPRPRIVPSGTKVFFGHGRSHEWRKLKDFIQDRIGLEWDEFNRVPVAGVTNIGRLGEMLDEAAIAFLVMTAEDEQADGALRARENVVHEAGLFQGRLGFMKAIVMVEDTCEPFSNIDGLGQLRFPKGRIEAVFEDVRAVLEREGMLERPDADA